MKLEAPYPDVKMIVTLPEPEFGDTERSESRIQIKRAMDGTVRTYIKKVNNKSLNYQFILTREKALELYDLFSAYPGAQMRMDGKIGFLKINPLVLVMERRGVIANSKETVTVELEFEDLNS